MPFTGKATYSGGPTMPETAEDVSDLVAATAPAETPLLDTLGDARHPARGVVHEWLEDEPLPDTDVVVEAPDIDRVIVGNPDRFARHDLLRLEASAEVMRVEDVLGTTIVLTRAFGGSPAGADPDAGNRVHIISGAAPEGAPAAEPRFTVRKRRWNTTQIFSATVEVSGSLLAVRQIAVGDEMEYQKARRLRELLVQLERTVVHGVASSAEPSPGTSDAPRTMHGLLASVRTHRFSPGTGGMDADPQLTEPQLNHALRTVWQEGAGSVDLIVVGGRQKRAINRFVGESRRFTSATDRYRDAVGVYESDFGVCRIVLCRHVPDDTVMLLDSSRLRVVPLAGRSFHYRTLARQGDAERGQVVGEYTLEVRNEQAHGVITGLAV